MAYSFDQFCRDAHDALKANPDRSGREKVREHLEKLLQNKDFVAETCGPQAEVGVHQIYRDPDLDFVVLAHINDAPRQSPPHDHGSSWAIYGQASEYTDMTEYERLDGGAGAGEAKIEKLKTYRLTPGHAGLYDVGAIHAIDYPAGARFVRVTGTDLATVERLKFDMNDGKAEVIQSVGAG